MQGSPVISISWFKNGLEIISDLRHSMCFDTSIATLDVERCTVEDSGQYVCMASNEAGTDQCSSSVTVKGWFSPFNLRGLVHPVPHVHFITSQRPGFDLGVVPSSPMCRTVCWRMGRQSDLLVLGTSVTLNFHHCVSQVEAPEKLG